MSSEETSVADTARLSSRLRLVWRGTRADPEDPGSGFENDINIHCRRYFLLTLYRLVFHLITGHFNK